MTNTRRAPGQVRDAIVRYLSGHPGPAPLSEIHAGVERDLGGSVAKSSVRSYLNLGTGSTFDRIGRGSYRLRS